MIGNCILAYTRKYFIYAIKHILESVRQDAADEPIKHQKVELFFPILLGCAQIFEPHARCEYDS